MAASIIYLPQLDFPSCQFVRFHFVLHLQPENLFKQYYTGKLTKISNKFHYLTLIRILLRIPLVLGIHPLHWGFL